ncbi:MAG TPA: choice-of-anchor E domain-containing protein [Phycisphaerae bacterium]|nr:choice-of-anchor E domain-containing protein [Phycisphaerae bacterium]
MRQVTRGFQCLLITLAAASSAAANEITQISAIPVGGETFLDFMKFDPALGTLQGVRLSLAFDFSVQVGFENLAGAPRTISGGGGPAAVFVLTDEESFEYGHALTLRYDFSAESVDAFDGTLDFLGGSGRTSPLIQDSQVEDIPIAPEEIPLFVGTTPLVGVHTIASSPQFSEHLFGGGSQDIAAYYSAIGTSTLTLTYEYAPVPEPATAALTMMAILCVIRLRKTSAKSIASN